MTAFLPTVQDFRGAWISAFSLPILFVSYMWAGDAQWQPLVAGLIAVISCGSTLVVGDRRIASLVTWALLALGCFSLYGYYLADGSSLDESMGFEAGAILIGVIGMFIYNLLTLVRFINRR